MPRTLLALVLLLHAGCAAPPSPFPELGRLSDAELLETLRRRTAPVRSLYAELVLDYRGKERTGRFEAVCRWSRGGAFELVAFKDLVLSTRYVFELELTGDRYRIEVDPEGESPRRGSGPVGELAGKFLEFAVFELAREALFLPGSLGPHATVQAKERISTATSSGAPIEWRIERGTLEVTAALLPGARRLRYADYRRHGPAFLPWNVTLEDGPRTIVTRVRKLELEYSP